jgi:hypothetical protein
VARVTGIDSKDIEFINSSVVRLETSMMLGGLPLPAGSRKLSVELKVGGPETDAVVAEYGIPWSTHEFAAQSLNLTHPFEAVKSIQSPANLVALFNILTLGPTAVKIKRLRLIASLGRLSIKMASEEAAMRASMVQGVREVMAKKRLVVLRALLEEVGYKDTTLIDELSSGMAIIGPMTITNEFPRRTLPLGHPKPHSVEVLKTTAKWAQHAVQGVRGSDAAMERQVRDITMDEARVKKWLDGPYTASEVTRLLGEDWVPVRRFGITQGNKVRAIGDGSVYLPNATVEAFERVELGGFEEYVSLAKEWCRSVSSDRSVCVTMPDGVAMRGRLHKEWSLTAARTLVGRTADMSHAYKQVAVRPDHRKFSVVAVANPSGGADFFVANTLLFGQSAAVYAVNRVARALQRVCTVLGDLVMTNYFDDFPQLEAEVLGDSARATVKEVFGVLGVAARGGR